MKQQTNNYMQRAYHLAQQAQGRTSPNPMVGAVIVKAGRIIAEGWHQRCGAAHAEVNAISQAGKKAKGATLYVTLEPCSHTGRTGPCTQAIIDAGIKKVFIGVLDPNPLTHHKSIAILRKAGIEVEVGFLQEELTAMNAVFNKYITQKMPYVVAKSAQTLDGKIGTSTGDSKWITSERSRAYAHERRKEFDAIMVGINTVLKDDPQLNAPGRFRPIKKVILDSSLKISLKAKIFQVKDLTDIIIVTTKYASQAKVRQLTRKGVQVWISNGSAQEKQVCLKWLMRELAAHEISSVLLEGGGCLIGSALRDQLVDRMMIYVSPKIIGDQSAVASITGLNVLKISQALELKNMFIQLIDQDILVEGDLVYGNH